MSPYREQQPGPEHSDWLECTWSVESEQALRGYAVRPDGCLDIVYSAADGLRAVGTMTAAQQFDFPARSWSTGVRFRPGMATSFLGVPASELTDRIVPLEDVWGGNARRLEERLRQARTPGETMRLLLSAIPPPSVSPDPVQRAIAAIVAEGGSCDLDWMARQANLSSRQFRRRCLDKSGLSPKHLSRVLRFRRAWQLADRSTKPEWSSIAAEAGYFDQAHLIRDFHEFAGAAPMAVFSNTAAATSG